VPICKKLDMKNISCPRCNSDTWQSCELGALLEDLSFVINNRVFVCANCGYTIAKPEDIRPPVITVHLTGESLSNQQRILQKYNLFDPDRLDTWHRNRYLQIEDHLFCSKDTWKKSPPAVPEGVLLKIIDEI